MAEESKDRELLIVLFIGGLFLLFILYMRKQQYPLGVGAVGVAGGAIPVVPANQTASNIDAILAGAASTVPSILGGIKDLFVSGSNVPGSNTSAGPVEPDNVSYNTDYSPQLDETAYDSESSMETLSTGSDYYDEPTYA